MLKVIELHKTYDLEPALQGVSFSVQAGEIVGLLGPNGAGKTTTLSIITQVLRPDGGEVVIGGIEIDSDPRLAKHQVGYAAQGTAIYPVLTVKENLTFFAALNGVDKRNVPGRVQTVVDDLDLSAVAGRRAGTLSGGEQRRVHVAAALLHQPGLLLLDEPTVGMDVEGRARLHDVLRGEAARGTAVCFSSHYLAEVEDLCDRVVVLSGGQVIAEGAVEALVDDMASPYLSVNFADGGEEMFPLGDEHGDVPATLLALGDRLADVAAMTIVRPSLESVYIALTGRRFEGPS